jgi:hypothetical protein
MQKQCAGCGVWDDPEYFPYTMNARSNKRFAMKECKICRNKNARTIRALKKLVPQPPEGSKCDICSRNEKRLILDHDHSKTGISAFRGWLCMRCNVSAASYSIPELQNTISYLERAEARSKELCNCEFDVSTCSDSSELSNGSAPETL